MTNPNVSEAKTKVEQRVLHEVYQGRMGSAEELARRLGQEASLIEEVCERLVRRGRLVVLRPDDLRILRAVRDRTQGSGSRPLETEAPGDAGPEAAADEAGRSVSTTALSEALDEMDGAGRRAADRRSIYHRCRRLEVKLGLLRSETRPSSRRLLFVPATGQVINRSNYPEIDRVLRDLRTIARRYPLKRGAQIPPPVKESLRREYRRYLEDLAARSTPHECDQVRRLESELMKVLSGTTLADVISLFGVRAFHPKAREWRPVQDALIDWILDNAVGGGALPGPVYLPPPGRLDEEEETDPGSETEEEEDLTSERTAPVPALAKTA